MSISPSSFPTVSPLKILVIDDHALVREGLRLLLQGLTDSVTVFDTSSVPEALELTQQNPDLDLVFVGTGNAEPYNPKYRAGMDSLFAASVLAIRPKTGEMVWYYQFMPNDSYDYDATAENIVADIQIDGKPRKVLINVNKNGFVYVLDRTNGKPIAAHPFTAQNWAKYIDLKTGRPVLTDLYDKAVKGETIDLNPRLGTNASLSAFNPRTGMLYLNSWEIFRVMKFVDEKLVIGSGYTGIETSSKIPEITGYHVAMNPLTGKTAWKIPLRDFAVSAGTLGTDGGLLFTGKLTGEVIALDQETGKQLWQFKTGSSINAPVITYTHKGQQYVTVLSGRGGSNPSRSAGASSSTRSTKRSWRPAAPSTCSSRLPKPGSLASRSSRPKAPSCR